MTDSGYKHRIPIPDRPVVEQGSRLKSQYTPKVTTMKISGLSATKMLIRGLLCLVFFPVNPGEAALPVFQSQVIQSQGATRYVYTVTNPVPNGSIADVGGFLMPVGDMPFDVVLPDGWRFLYPEYPPHTSAFFGFHVTTPTAILEYGESVSFEIVTTAPVYTVYQNYFYARVYPADGRAYGLYSDTPVPMPTPVPEPATLATLACGLAGMVSVVRRKRV